MDLIFECRMLVFEWEGVRVEFSRNDTGLSWVENPNNKVIPCIACAWRSRSSECYSSLFGFHNFFNFRKSSNFVRKPYLLIEVAFFSPPNWMILLEKHNKYTPRGYPEIRGRVFQCHLIFQNLKKSIKSRSS